MAETRYSMAFGETLTIKPEWIRDTYAEASAMARSNTGPQFKTYVVRIVPVSVFSAKVVMEPLAQDPAPVLPFEL